MIPTKKSSLLILVFWLFALIIALFPMAYGATYYVDYDSGDDASEGTSEGTAWQHVPGDPNATGIANEADLTADDRVLFRGGVRYQGRIVVQSSGDVDLPITYSGNAWGSEKAIIDGGLEFGSNWTLCASAAACGGNPDFANIYHTAAPVEKTFQSGFFEDGEFVWAAQDPNPSDRFHYDRIDGLRVIPLSDASVFHTRTAITDPRFLTQSDADYYNGAYVAVWHNPNVTTVHRVTGFDPTTHTLSHEDLGNDVYDDRDTYYAILNHLGALDSPGEFFFDEAGGRFYLWPGDSANPDSHTYTVCGDSAGIFASGRHDLVLEGFKVQGHQMGIRAIGTGAGNVVIRDNEVNNLFSNNWYAVQVQGDNMTVENNRVTDCLRAVGILAGGNRITISNNHVQRTSRQGIWFMGVETGKIIDNAVVEMRGTHSNGISVYLHHENILIARNQIFDSNSALTYHGDNDPDHVNNLVIYGNLVDGRTNSWGKGMRGVTILNNTFLGPVGIPAEDAEVVFINNIVHGGGRGDTCTHNLYTDLAWNQAHRYGWSPGTGEIVGTGAEANDYVPIDPATVFESYGTEYNLAAASMARNSGTDVSGHLPAATFPEVDFSLDLNRQSRGQGDGWDLGAYEFNEDGPGAGGGGSGSGSSSSGSGGCFVSTLAN